MDKIGWKHRTRVYKFGVVWHWKCQRLGCGEGGRERQWRNALIRARNHTYVHGSYLDHCFDTPRKMR